MTFDPFGFKSREKATANILQAERERRIRTEIRARSRFASLFAQNSPKASISTLESELYPAAEKSQNSMYRTSALYSGDNRRLQRLSRIALFESPTGRALVDRIAESVVGAGLMLRPQPMWDLIPGAPTEDEDRASWVRNVEHRYRLWAKSYRPEYNTRRNLYQLSRAVFDYLVQDGEYFVLFRHATARFFAHRDIVMQHHDAARLTTKPCNTLCLSGFIVHDVIRYGCSGRVVFDTVCYRIVADACASAGNVFRRDNLD